MADGEDNTPDNTPNNVFSLASVRSGEPDSDVAMDDQFDVVSDDMPTPAEAAQPAGGGDAQSDNEGQQTSMTHVSPVMAITGSTGALFTYDGQRHCVTPVNDQVGAAFAQAAEANAEQSLDAMIWSPVTNQLHPVSDFMAADSPYKDPVSRLSNVSRKPVAQVESTDQIERLVVPYPGLEQALEAGRQMREHSEQTDSEQGPIDQMRAGQDGEPDPHAVAQGAEQSTRKAPEPRNSLEALAMGSGMAAFHLSKGLVSGLASGLGVLGQTGWAGLERVGRGAYQLQDWATNRLRREPGSLSEEVQEAEHEQPLQTQQSQGQGVETRNEALSAAILGVSPGAHPYQEFEAPEPGPEQANYAQAMYSEVPPPVEFPGETEAATSNFALASGLGDRINAWASKQHTESEQAQGYARDVRQKVNDSVDALAETAGVASVTPKDTIMERLSGLSEDRRDQVYSKAVEVREQVETLAEQTREWVRDHGSSFNRLDSEDKDKVIDELSATFDPDDERSPLHQHKTLLEHMELDEEKNSLMDHCRDVLGGMKAILERLKNALAVMGLYRAEADEINEDLGHEAEAGPSLQ